jgi:hypothetical protein
MIMDEHRIGPEMPAPPSTPQLLGLDMTSVNRNRLGRRVEPVLALADEVIE